MHTACPACRGPVDGTPGQLARCPSCQTTVAIPAVINPGFAVEKWLYYGLVGLVLGGIIGLSLWLIYVNSCLFLVLFALLGCLLPAGIARTRRTARPLNYCGHCGHSWYPRGRDHSPRCPWCGATR